MKIIAVYPGTFDPVTYGHIDVVRRALKIFDEVIVAVAKNPFKNPLFSMGERLEMVSQSLKDLGNVSVQGFDGMLVEYAKKKNAKAIVRGLRVVSDFEYEYQMVLTNRKLAGEVETVFLMPSEDQSYVSSKLIKELVSLGADVSQFVPPHVVESLNKKLRK